MIEIEGIPADRIHYIPNGVATADDAGAPADVRRIREALGVPVDAPLVGAVGSLRPQKAFEVLIDAAVLLRARHPGIRVVIAGGGDEQPTLQAHIDRVGAGDVVSLLGARDDVRELLQAFDVAVNCSDFEGQPLSVLEEMDASLPIVATRVGGVPDLIDDGVHGRLVPPRDPAALAGAVDAMLADRDAARAMGARARIRRREEFDIAHTVRRTEALYETLLGARRATRSNAGPRASSNHSSFE
jgi:glycosyltransferase involved in cell wall biosynthesis